MCCSPVRLKDNKFPFESSYQHITQYHSIVQKKQQHKAVILFLFFIFLDKLGIPLLLSNCLDHGIVFLFLTLALLLCSICECTVDLTDALCKWPCPVK